ncbi:phage recombination protein Bet [Microbacterium plantarum]|uniref:phage recombination protein Bet n=1 Tax=Microbacterium plantarum TaxID=1816425 RepID=UPI002B47243A|nr:phage recombination protein Bet [Microbacterium plantarum]WRK16149.1 phage recombination protein Bet [Microbacterium plantarum]
MSAGTIERRPTIALPTTSDPELWTDDEKALLDAAGLVVRKKGKAPEAAPRPTVVAFLAHCQRTGLDPIARQIYAIERGGKWGIQVSIDGFRLVAERSRQYAGQKPVEWTADGTTWTDVWVAEGAPLAARATVLRRDFDEPLVAVARFASYVQLIDEYEGSYDNRRKTGRKVPGDMWARMPEVMIAKVAEALALRKAFPMELSGLYAEEEMDQALNADAAPQTPRAAAPTLEPGTRSAQRDPLPSAVTEASGEVTTPADPAEPSTATSEPVAGEDDPLRPTPEELAEWGGQS